MPFNQISKDFREKAEELINQLDKKAGDDLNVLDLKALLHEIKVHQIELELQNEELQRVQFLLDQEKEQFRELFDYAPSGYILLNKNGVITQANLAFCKLFELPLAKVIGNNINAFVVSGSQDELYLHLRNTLENNNTEHCQLELKTAKAEKLWIKIESVSYYSNETREYLIRSSLTDISDNVKLAKELLNEKRLVDKILESVERYIITVDKEGSIIQFNKAGEKLTGYPASAILGKKLWRLPFQDKKYKNQVYNYFHELSKDKLPLSFENVWVNSFGVPVTINWNFSASIENGHLEFLIGVGENITELLRKEAKILRLSTAVEQSANSIVITDLNGNIEYANPRFYEVTGYTPEEVIGNNPRIVKYENSNVNYKELWDTISNGNTWRGEFINKTKSGESFWEIATITPVKNNKGEIINYLAIKENITYRKKIEEQLVKARDFYLNLLEDFPVMVWRSDPKGNFNFFNKTWLQYTGKSLEQEYSRWVFHDIHPDDKKIFQDGFRESLKRKTPFVIEYRLMDQFGNYRWVLTHGRPFNDLEGSYGGFIGISVDIHDRNLAEQRLIESEDNFRRMFEDSSLGIFRLDKTFSFVSANKAFAEMFGYDNPVDLLIDINNKPQTFFKDFSKENEFRKNFVRSEQDQFTMEREFFRRDGSIIYALIRLRKVNRRSKDKEFYVEGFIEDITSRKIAEQSLKDSEQKFRVLFEKSYDAILILDKNRIVDCNQKAARLFGLSCKKLLGSSAADLSPDYQLGDQSSKELFLYYIERALGGAPQSFEWLHLRDKKVFDSEVSLTRIIVNEKHMVQAIIRDISDKKIAEKQLRQAKEHAEKARTTQSEFLSLMSHEIRTPLNAVVALTDLLLQDKLNKEQKENLDSVKVSAKHLLGLIDDILDFNKIDSGNIQFEETEFEIRALVKDLYKTLLPKATEKDIDFSYSVSDDVPDVLIGDTLRLKQILYNLLSNAIKFTEEGFVQLIIERKNEFRNDERVLFIVEDTGIGIKDDKLDAIFEKFTQAEVSTSRKYGGSGLGLTICKKLVELQGGEIKAQSQAGKGSKFSFFVPLGIGKPIIANITETKSPGGSPDISDMKILLAEDDKMNQYVARKLIEKKWRAKLVVVDDGEMALRELEKNDYDLVLMDLLMPGMDGYQTTRQIRQNPNSKIKNPLIPIIALTADAFTETKKKAFDAGIDDFISKPFDYNNLLEKISKYKKT
jgi:two-component system, sensor histidine kinase